MNKWIVPVLVGIAGIVVGGGIIYYLTRPKESTSPSYPAAEPQPLIRPVRQSPIVCHSCGRTEYVIVDQVEEDKIWITCRYCGYHGTTGQIDA